MKKLLGSYKNGNYNVLLFEDGTKIRHNNENELIAAFPESIDLKISNRCNMVCSQCHEESVPDGALANLHHPLLDSLHLYTELALGGGNILEHPELEDFLKRMAARHIICNATLHLHHFLTNYDYLLDLSRRGLIHGLGVSVNSLIDEETVNKIKNFPNAVVHTIAGIMPWSGYVELANHNLKMLILGYKTYGRGVSYWCEEFDNIHDNIEILRQRLPYLMSRFSLISFDNLALEQLQIRELVGEEIWEKYYMGDDGQYTMYIDLVKQEYAISSVSPRIPIDSNKIEELFKKV